MVFIPSLVMFKEVAIKRKGLEHHPYGMHWDYTWTHLFQTRSKPKQHRVSQIFCWKQLKEQWLDSIPKPIEEIWMSDKRSVEKRTTQYSSPKRLLLLFCLWYKTEVFECLCFDPSFFKPQVFQYFCLTDAHPQEVPFVVTHSGLSSRALLFFENGKLSTDDLCSSFLVCFT